jgi:type II secretory ATPase GspE/PulE/Tfp pilus assembly ATPase PilB-like protein
MKEVRAQALRDGFIPMRAYGWEKVMAGETTLEEVVSVTSGD